MHPTHNDLPAKTRTKVARGLNQLLADSSDLVMQAKQAHWNCAARTSSPCTGCSMRSTSTRANGRTSSPSASRSSAGRCSAKTTRLSPYPLELVDEQAHVEQLASAMAKFGASVREAIDAFDGLGDKDTADLCTEISRELDKDLWFVEAHQGGNGARRSGRA